MTSTRGPRNGINSCIYRRDRFSSSVRHNTEGSTVTPPLPPPKGKSASAHFQLIQTASAATSPMSTLRAKRVPPGRPVRHMVLDAVAREGGDAAVIHMDRTHGDRALRQNETVAFVVGNFQMVGDHVKPLLRHLEHRPAKLTHFGRPHARQMTAAAGISAACCK
jgi:hypothetical protein